MPDSDMQKGNLLRDYEGLNIAISYWADNYFAKKDYLHIAISRKAPRLLEWTNMQDNAGGNTTIVTELALPFFDLTQYKKIVVADEAIYHGTTFEKTLSLIKEVNPSYDFLDAMPLVTTADALQSTLISQALVRGTSIINQDEIPFFVDTVISKFAELGKPYDVEYPLFYINFKEDITDELINNILGKLAHLQSKEYNVAEDEIDFYKVTNYNRERNIITSSFTYSTDYLYRDSGYGLAVPDFSKLRFFKKGNRLCVASMSPYVIPEQYLTTNSCMFAELLRSVWESIYITVKKYNKSNELRLYGEQRWKSLVMAANYLLSFNHFMKIRSSLLSAMRDYVDDTQFYLQDTDTVYLFGPLLGKDIVRKLHNIDKAEENFAFVNSGKDPVSMIPAAYAPNYNYQIAIDNLRKCQNRNISMMLSSMFSSQHWQVEVESRNQERSNYERLNFGESYDSIIDRLKNSSSMHSSDIRHKVHCGIDERIDRGSVVPGYVRITNGIYGEWRRLFRSGENEDIYKDQLLRTLLTIVSKCFTFSNTQFVSRATLEYVLAIIYLLENDSTQTIIDKKVFDMPLSIGYRNSSNTYELLANVDSEQIAVVEYAISSDVLKQDELGNILISSSTYAQRLNTGCALADKTVSQLNRIIRYVLDYTQHVYGGSDDIRELLNFYFYEDKEINLLLLMKRMKEELYDMIQNDNADENKLSDLADTCAIIYQRFPDPTMEIPDQKETDGELYKFLALRFENTSEKVKDRKQLFEAYYLDAPLNLWSYYKNKKTYLGYNEDLFNEYVEWLDGQSTCFNDGVRCHDWLDIPDSYMGIEKFSDTEVRKRLLELLH